MKIFIQFKLYEYKCCILIFFLVVISSCSAYGQTSLVTDGFGGRLWYCPYNYTVGSYSAFAICGEEKQLYGWGHNSHCELGNGTSIGSSIPVIVVNMDSVFYFSTGYVMGAIKLDRSGWAWGSAISSCLPIKVLDTVMFVDAGIASCAFVKYDGTVWSVGANNYGEFGDGNFLQNNGVVPKKMQNISTAVRTAQGEFTTCVLLKDGTVWCAGSDQWGGIGDGDSNNSTALKPRKVKNLENIVDIKANSRINIALDKNGDVWTWGYGYYGLGSSIGSVPDVHAPEKISTLKNIIAISGSNDGAHFLALDSAKQCYAWGANSSSGQCGDGTLNNLYSAKIVASDVVEIMAGETFSYIIKSDSSLWGAGRSNMTSIWLNLPDSNRKLFAKIDPMIPPFSLCKPTPFPIIDTFKIPITDSHNNSIVLYFPNVFSPNGDSKNEIFKAIVNPSYEVENYRLRIYNRWGNLVYNTSSLSEGWNGKYNNQEAPIETYFYLAQYNQPSKPTRLVKGDLILLR